MSKRGEANEKSGRGSFHNLIFAGMGAGLVAGLLLHWRAETNPGLFEGAVWWLDLFGPTLFIGALKMIIAPLILASIVAGVTSLPSASDLGRIGFRTIAYYLTTTTVAVAIGLVAVTVIAPGKRDASIELRDERAAVLSERRAEYERSTGSPPFEQGERASPTYLEWLAQKEGEQQGGAHGARYEVLAGASDRSAADMLRDDVLRPILSNPFEALSSNPPNALGIIFFSLLLGVACIVIGERASPVVRAFAALNEVMLTITNWLMKLSPFAIGCIVAGLVAKNGPGVFRSLGWYSATVVGGIAVHVVALLAICRFMGGLGPRELWRGLREAWLIAFTTRSSAATLPVTMRCVTEKLGVHPKVANFGLPLGATMNMDGTALYEGVAVMFLIQIYGGLDDVQMAVTAGTLLVIFITAVLASVGAAAVPDAGLVTMVLVASAVHLPIYYIPLIFAVDAFLDMFRTSTNVLGDVVGAVVVDRFERKTSPALAMEGAE